MERSSSGEASFPVLATLFLFALATLLGCAGLSVSTSRGPNSINGTVVNDATGQPVAGAIVLLEQPDAGGIDRVIASTTTASDGSFAFSALPSGKYDIVTAASVTSPSGATTTYAATVTFLVPLGTTANGIPLVPEFGNSMPNGLPAGIVATVATSGLSGAPAQADIKLSALQGATPEGGSPVQVTIPTFAGSTPEITTTLSPGCPTGTACANYLLFVPSSAPVVGTFSPGEIKYAFPALDPVEVIYVIEGRAFVHGSGATPDCMPSRQTAGPVVPRGTLASVIPNLVFTGCQ